MKLEASLILALCFLLFASFFLSTELTVIALPTGFLHTAGRNILDSNGNSLELYGTQVAGFMDPLSQTDFNYFVDYGINKLEVNMIRWNTLEPSQDSYSSSVIGYLDNCLALAQTNKVYFAVDIANFHASGGGLPSWVSSMVGSPSASTFENGFFNLTDSSYDDPRDAFKDMWIYLINRYKTNPYFLVSIINEPYNGNTINNENDPVQSANYAETMEWFIDAFAGEGGAGYDNIIFVNWAWVMSQLSSITDVYRSSVVWEYHDYVTTSQTLATFESQIENWDTIYGALNKPLFIGEYGFLGISGESDNTFFNWQNILSAQVDFLDGLSLCGKQWHNYDYLSWRDMPGFTYYESLWILDLIGGEVASGEPTPTPPPTIPGGIPPVTSAPIPPISYDPFYHGIRDVALGSGFQIYLNTTHNTLGFDSEVVNSTFQIEVLTGEWNGTDVFMGITNRGGYLLFDSNSAAEIQVSHNNAKNLRLEYQNLAFSTLTPGHSWNGTIPDDTEDCYLRWSFPIDLPWEEDFMLWIGLFGLALMISGLLLGAYSFKKYPIFSFDKETIWETSLLIYSFAAVFIGFGLVMTWLLS